MHIMKRRTSPISLCRWAQCINDKNEKEAIQGMNKGHPIHLTHFLLAVVICQLLRNSYKIQELFFQKKIFFFFFKAHSW